MESKALNLTSDIGLWNYVETWCSHIRFLSEFQNCSDRYTLDIRRSPDKVREAALVLFGTIVL
ncbi:hypothetical protein BES34_013760 [Leptospira inadai serovar Lyme]|uniref:Uncharacterized protein n=1 Tax=Leptospira inadai serovar Lyme TaxID=293084 RepID=A0ABX4YGP9_9LEPT|nr:hypothetical protein BES34_013760 [Leptospira inadai serovar Lyme]